MSVESVMARIAEIQTALSPRPAAVSGSSSFQAVLGAQTDAVPGTALGLPATQAGWVPAATSGAGANARAAIVQAAGPEVGQAEHPPGCNYSPWFPQYRV